MPRVTRRAVAACVLVLTVTAGCSGGNSKKPESRPSPSMTAAAAADSARMVVASPTAPASPSPAPPAGGCRILPPDNIWHSDVSRLPVHASSAAFVASIGATGRLHADFGAGLIDGSPFGIPVTTVRPDQPTAPVTFEYRSESDPGPYPVPKDALVEGGPNADGDRHVILFDPSRCRVHELYAARPQADGSWRAGSGAVYDLTSHKLRPAGWTSADAAGLPILPGLVRYDEVAAGRVDHAIRITAPRTRNNFVWPARHAASSRPDPSLPPMGLRLRLKAGVDISRLPGQARIVAQALKT